LPEIFHALENHRVRLKGRNRSVLEEHGTEQPVDFLEGTHDSLGVAGVKVADQSIAPRVRRVAGAGWSRQAAGGVETA
jgi:hypothetical protein